MTLDTLRAETGSRRRSGWRARSALALLLVAVVTVTLPTAAAERTLERVSLRPDGSPSEEGSGFRSALSADGRYVAFSSLAGDLVEGDTNGVEDVFVRDLLMGLTTRVSVATDGREGDGSSCCPSLSADGRVVAFSSSASQLVDGDMNEVNDVFVRDLERGVTTRASVGLGPQEDGHSGRSAISANGRFVAFESRAGNLVEGDTNEVDDVFVRDLERGVTTRVSVATDGAEGASISQSPSISGDGRLVVFASFASNLAEDSPQGFWGVYLHDLETKTTSLLSVNSWGDTANEDSLSPAISGDGRVVVFASLARNLTEDSPQGDWAIYLHDRETGTTSWLSRGVEGGEPEGDSDVPAISYDGRYVAFQSSARNLVEGDTNATRDIFLHDRSSGETTRLSVASDGGEAADESSWAAISGDGAVVAFESWADDLVSDGARFEKDVYVSAADQGS